MRRALELVLDLRKAADRLDAAKAAPTDGPDADGQALVDALRALARIPGGASRWAVAGGSARVAELSLDRVIAATLAVYERLSATAED